MKEIALAFLKLGVLSYGGPAIMGIMQSELQEKRRWVSKERFVEGLSLVAMLPGATATQLGIFLGHARGGWRGGLLAGLCFVLPGFAIMLALAAGYAALGAAPAVRGALYGLGPVVLGIFAVAVWRLGRSAIAGPAQALIAVAAAAAAASSAAGTAGILLLAGGLGLLLFHSRRTGTIVLACIAAALIALRLVFPPVGAAPGAALAPELAQIALFFFKVGALTFGGGLTMIAFIHEQVVGEFGWLTAAQFIDGLALGQMTPGPILMVAAYVGYQVAGIAGAAAAAGAAFLPSFLLMLSLLPVLDRARQQGWMKAAMKGIGPAVIGVLAVSLAQLAPHALPDAFAALLLAATVACLLLWRIGAAKLMLAGALLGLLRSRV